MTVRKRLRAHGRVQGVFFRDSLRRAAEREGVSGWAANRDDGTSTSAEADSALHGCVRSVRWRPYRAT